jgi:hypothetical protein
MTHAKLTSVLTASEKQAGQSYGTDSLFFHACWQGRANDLLNDPGYSVFAPTYSSITSSLDTAVAKSILHSDVTLYSGYGRGYSILGSLTGDAARFIGLDYKYPGFISTSESRIIAEDKFMRVSAASGTRPTLLEFRMSAGQCALDMHEVGHQGEIEYLLPRNQLFKIVDAQQISVQDVGDRVMHLTLSLSHRETPSSLPRPPGRRRVID